MTAALKVLLFDVDHTLLAAGGAGFRAMYRAFFERYGVENATRGIAPDGKTDPMLFGEALVRCRLAAAGSPPPPKLVRRYETLFPEEMAAPPAQLMPGVRELLDALSGHPQVLLGLLTGNLERTARIQLDRFRLNCYFPFGAFGSYSSMRFTKLVRLLVLRNIREEKFLTFLSVIGIALGIGLFVSVKVGSDRAISSFESDVRGIQTATNYEIFDISGIDFDERIYRDVRL